MDEDEPIASADVMLVNAKNNRLLKQTLTDENGSYYFSVKPGHYSIKSFRDDYAAEWIKGIEVKAQDVEINITLTPAVFVDDTSGSESDECD